MCYNDYEENNRWAFRLLVKMSIAWKLIVTFNY